ncbi:MAG: nucleotide sugar dehydrogenase [Prolixibacteraceae bacterium]|mgnify:CR=1 FL=1|jgi:UDP-N-acetyl-D-glucosamine dehydrogenase|nr:nucleotide sugar dehydrogenase [Prolixibacteraceae bacterium]MBT6004287.1 nucleotide sugar dehydrogenase [Prolixibacteraceae bacterium]MBT6767127.1 nucleotide sugar dehydrogenase [Prolixibacteraceae bacterium]MBT7000531.1 nucleotide sugar dehydrogenase [Prolixibacteraceae bacterium]MBT7393479.1 nucleotide sugar dehydrogenase [Prolixibacteraceae bacterium]
MNIKKEILYKVNNKQLLIGVVGLGYVGLPLSVSFAQENNQVLGFDKSEEKIKKINSGENYIGDIQDDDLISVVNKGLLSASNDFSLIKKCDVLLICVPTPLDKFRKPDMSYIESACIEIGKNMKRGTFICLESTTYPTTTEHFMLPIIERESGFKHENDFWLAFSPERVDPGNKEYFTKNTPKVLGALTKDGLEIGEAIYKLAIENVHLVSSPRVAEMVKILENTYRLVNISLINELALLSGKMDINIWEVIEAAKTKPFGFQAFYPGPGVGGHCIPLDPFYLEHIAKKFNFDLTMINTAGHIDMLMAHRMTLKITSALNRHKKSINGSIILFLGVAYKPNINDERESPALKIIDEVINKGGNVRYHDPYISEIKTPENKQLKSIKLSPDSLKIFDCVVITTNHSEFDASFIERNSKMIVDLRNLIKVASNKVYKL